MYKVGIGYDVHQLKKGEKLILGGIEIESDYGIVGLSLIHISEPTRPY